MAVGATRASVIRRLAEHGPTPEPEPAPSRRPHGASEGARCSTPSCIARPFKRARAADRTGLPGQLARLVTDQLVASSPTSLTTARDSGDAASSWPVPASTTCNPDAVHELPARARRRVSPPSRRSPAGMTRSGTAALALWSDLHLAGRADSASPPAPGRRARPGGLDPRRASWDPRDEWIAQLRPRPVS